MSIKERPIIFSGPMVRALLDGRKTQTRRVVKPQPVIHHGWVGGGYWERKPASLSRPVPERWCLRDLPKFCPYGKPGDRLWVRHNASLFPVYFKPIVAWEGLYAAGTDGLVYRMDRGEPEVLSGSPTSKGYLTVSLSRGQWETHAVHKLVCETFYGASPFDGAQVRHMDGDQTNNRPENLDWGTQEQNWQDRKAHGRGMGEEHHSAKLTPGMVAAIRASGLSQRKLAAEYRVSQATIWEAKNGATWGKHDPAPRNLPAFKMWRPSIHMPRWASRITLEITDVRVEQLQSISDADIGSEGVTDPRGAFDRHHFAHLWESINGAGSWNKNPWIWALSFKRINHG